MVYHEEMIRVAWSVDRTQIELQPVFHLGPEAVHDKIKPLHFPQP